MFTATYFSILVNKSPKKIIFNSEVAFFSFPAVFHDRQTMCVAEQIPLAACIKHMSGSTAVCNPHLAVSNSSIGSLFLACFQIVLNIFSSFNSRTQGFLN